MSQLEKQFEFYLAHQQDLVDAYDGRVLLISDSAVVGDFATFEDALTAAGTKGLKAGTYLIQRCSRGNADYTQVFHTRVAFA